MSEAKRERTAFVEVCQRVNKQIRAEKRLVMQRRVEGVL